MEFHFGAVDHRRSPPPSPIFNGFHEPPYPPPPMSVDSIPAPWRYTFSGGPTRFPARGHRRWFRGPVRRPDHASDRDMWEWDREMERIREEEIILAEMARCREIELEVRRDIVFLEREMAARRAEFSFDDDRFCAMQYNPGPFRAPERWRSDPGPVWQRSVSGWWHEWHEPSSRPAMLAMLPHELDGELNGSPEPDTDKLIVLAKPNPHISGTKRKAVEPPALAEGETYPFGLKKKPKAEWSCALCKVSTRSEKLLNDHLHGKKHVAKEEKLKAAKIPTESIVPKKTKTGTPNSKLKAEAEWASLEEKGTGSASKTNKNDLQDLKSKRETVPKKYKIARDLKNTAGSETMQRSGKAKERKKENFKFWCEMCQVGTPCLQVMEDHKKGKKHMGMLHKQKRSDQAASETSHISQEVIVQKPEDSIVHESNNRDKTSPKTTPASLEVIIPKPEVPKIASQLLKAVFVPEPEKPEPLKVVIVPNPGVSLQANSSNGAASAQACISPGLLF